MLNSQWSRWSISSYVYRRLRATLIKNLFLEPPVTVRKKVQKSLKKEENNPFSPPLWNFCSLEKLLFKETCYCQSRGVGSGLGLNALIKTRKKKEDCIRFYCPFFFQQPWGGAGNTAPAKPVSGPRPRPRPRPCCPAHIRSCCCGRAVSSAPSVQSQTPPSALEPSPAAPEWNL